MQLDELRSFSGRRGWQIVGEYTDEGISGSRESRPGLDKLIADARRRRFDCVLVFRYDRFARSLKHLVSALALFDSLGIQFVSLREGVDTSTPNGRLVFGIFASIAEFERSLIADRVRSGMAAAKRRGVKLGRPAVDVSAIEVQRLRDAGLSFVQIARQTGVSVGTIHRVATQSKPLEIKD